MKKSLLVVAFLSNCALLNAKRIHVAEGLGGVASPLEDLILESGNESDATKLSQLTIFVADINQGIAQAGWIYDLEGEIKNLMGVNALMHAALQGNEVAVNVLLANGADPNAQANPQKRIFYQDFTPLAFAAHNNKAEIVKILAPITDLTIKYNNQTIRDIVYYSVIKSLTQGVEGSPEMLDIIDDTLVSQFKARLSEGNNETAKELFTQMGYENKVKVQEELKSDLVDQWLVEQWLKNIEEEAGAEEAR